VVCATFGPRAGHFHRNGYGFIIHGYLAMAQLLPLYILIDWQKVPIRQNFEDNSLIIVFNFLILEVFCRLIINTVLICICSFELLISKSFLVIGDVIILNTV
jgi:hypothetical protein